MRIANKAKSSEEKGKKESSNQAETDKAARNGAKSYRALRVAQQTLESRE